MTIFSQLNKCTRKAFGLGTSQQGPTLSARFESSRSTLTWSTLFLPWMSSGRIRYLKRFIKMTRQTQTAWLRSSHSCSTTIQLLAHLTESLIMVTLIKWLMSISIDRHLWARSSLRSFSDKVSSWWTSLIAQRQLTTGNYAPLPSTTSTIKKSRYIWWYTIRVCKIILWSISKWTFQPWMSLIGIL